MLAGWILEHRRTDDLDLFTEHDEAIGDADRLVRSGAATIGATVESVRWLNPATRGRQDIALR